MPVLTPSLAEVCGPVLNLSLDNVLKVSSRGGLEVERPLRIQLKASHYCLGGSNPAWGMVLAVIIH